MRQLVIMGSGETTPGMLGVHRDIFSGLPEDPSCLLMDSPFAFQENADELVERISAYFEESVGQPVERISLPAGADALALEQALAQIRSADWLFAGPGSPSYARRCWSGTPVPEAMASVVAPGRDGVVLIASAAAVTLGDWALPVYEIYKVGEDPRWEPGLGVTRRILGWRCAVVPHYDNREGGTHDTRYCYVGARRLEQIEPEIGDGFILGVDEHTAMIIDLDTRAVQVRGRGGVTLRVAGVEEVLESGTLTTLDDIEGRIAALGAGAAVGGPGSVASDGVDAGTSGAPDLGARGDAGASTGGADAPAGGAGPDVPADADVEALGRIVLASIPDTDAGARAALVGLVAQAQDAATASTRELAASLVDALVEVRSASRAAGDWAGSDRLRDVLDAAGVEVRDSREGTSWTWR